VVNAAGALLSGLRWLTRGKRGFLLVASLATLMAFFTAHGRAVASTHASGWTLRMTPRIFGLSPTSSLRWPTSAQGLSA
jgi:hypothetical protein